MMLLSSYLSFVLFVSENDSTFGQVVGTHLHLDLVARQDFNIALFLSYMATSGKSCTEIRRQYPAYVISKNKIELRPGMDVKAILAHIADKYSDKQVNTIDGVKIDFDNGWVHLRPSNTEPIIRIYAEAETETLADNMATKIIGDIREFLRG